MSTNITMSRSTGATRRPSAPVEVARLPAVDAPGGVVSRRRPGNSRKLTSMSSCNDDDLDHVLEQSLHLDAAHR